MVFIAEKDPGLIPKILSVILDECINGVSLADPDLPDMPIVYVNKAFEKMTGYAKEEVIDKNCRFLQGNNRNQEQRFVLANAIKNRTPIEVTLENFKKNGDLFYNQLKLTPLFDSKGNLLYFLGVQHDVTNLILQEKEIQKLSQKIKLI